MEVQAGAPMPRVVVRCAHSLQEDRHMSKGIVQDVASRQVAVAMVAVVVVAVAAAAVVVRRNDEVGRVSQPPEDAPANDVKMLRQDQSPKTARWSSYRGG